MAQTFRQLENPKWTKVEFGSDLKAKNTFMGIIQRSPRSHSDINPTELSTKDFNQLIGFLCLGRSYHKHGGTRADYDTFFAVALFRPPRPCAVNLRVSFDSPVFPDPKSGGRVTSLDSIVRRSGK